jgi:hypothetical protein
MTERMPFRVQVPWADIKAALALLARDGVAGFQARPIGNRVVVDCADEADAQRLTAAFRNARALELPVDG